MPYALFPTVFGTCGIAWNHLGLTGLQLPEGSDPETARRVAAKGGDDREEEPSAAVAAVIGDVQDHFRGHLKDFTGLTFDWSRVSHFQRTVYIETQGVKAGFTCSYGDISRALALGPAGGRSVGAALGSNPWPLLVPCHRVVASGHKMTGFSAPGGIRTKTRLLALEGAELLSE